MPPRWKSLRYPPAGPARYAGATLALGAVFGGPWWWSDRWPVAAIATFVLCLFGLADMFFLRAPHD